MGYRADCTMTVISTTSAYPQHFAEARQNVNEERRTKKMDVGNLGKPFTVSANFSRLIPSLLVLSGQ